MSKQTVLMTAVGSYLPANVVTNDDLSVCVETSDEWIRRRTGITQRHFVADGETLLTGKSRKNALKQAGLALDIDFIIVATTTPDNTFPSTATKVQHLIEHLGRFRLMCKPSVRALSMLLMLLMRCCDVGGGAVPGHWRGEFLKIAGLARSRNLCVVRDGAGAVIFGIALG